MLKHLIIALAFIAVFKLVNILSASAKPKKKTNFKIYNLSQKNIG